METFTTTLTSKGQMTLPVAFRKKLGVNTRDRLKISMKGSQVIVQKDDWQKNLHALQAKMAAHLKKHNIQPMTDEELDQAINDSAQAAAIERYQRSFE